MRPLVLYLGTAVITVAVTWSMGAAHAAEGTEFGEPEVVGRGAEPLIAVNASGAAVALWRRRSRGELKAAVRTRSGRWSAPWTVGRTGPPGYRGSQHAALAVDPRGDAVVVWLARQTFKRASVMAVRRPWGGRWSRPRLLAVIRGRQSDSRTTPSVRFDAAGNAIAVWSRFVAGVKDGYRVQAAIGTPDGAWSEPQQLGRTNIRAALDVTPAGQAIVMWPEVTFTSGVLTSTRLVASLRPVGGSWSSEETVVTGTSTPVAGASPEFEAFSTARVVMRSDGTATALWKTFQSTQPRLETSTRSAGGIWSPPETLDARADVLGGMILRAAAQGGVAAVWLGDTNEDTNVRVLRASEQGADGHWSQPVVSLARGYVDVKDAALSASGHLVVLAARLLHPRSGTGHVLDAYVRTPEDGWLSAQRLAGPADYRRACQSARLAFAQGDSGLIIRSCGARPGRAARVSVQTFTAP